MRIEEFYEKVGGSYDEVLNRLPSEAMIKKYLLRFLDDPFFGKLEKAWRENDVQEAFLAAHTLKGTAAVLGLGALSAASDVLTEKLRNAVKLADDDFFDAVSEAYAKSISCIKVLE